MRDARLALPPVVEELVGELFEEIEDELGDDIGSYCLKKIKQCLHWLSPPSVPQFPEVPVVTRLF